MTRSRYKVEGEGWIARVLNGFYLRNEWLQPQASAERTRCTTGKESITNEPNVYHIFPILDHDLGVRFIHCSSEVLVVSAQLFHWFIVITTWESKSSLASGVRWRTVAINFQEYVGWRREPPSYCRPKKIILEYLLRDLPLAGKDSLGNWWARYSLAIQWRSLAGWVELVRHW